MNKVFAIGANKTGTTSLMKAFDILGLGPTGNFNNTKKLILNWEAGDLNPIFEHANKFKSFKDGPWCYCDFYKDLDKQFPDSKFILTIRHCNDWFRSLVNHHTIHKNLTTFKPYMAMYGLDSPDITPASLKRQRNKIIDSYNRRNIEIIEYFKHTDKLLLMSIDKNFEWEVLTKFLNITDFDNTKPFPYKNKTKKK